MNLDQLATAKHEAMHALYAFAVGRYTVEYCSMRPPLPETSVLFELRRHSIAASYAQDPEGTAWELERMLGVACANGTDTSASDYARAVPWERQWPDDAHISWVQLENNARAQVREWLSDARVQTAILSLAVQLCVKGRLEGEDLEGRMWHALYCQRPNICHCAVHYPQD